MSNKKIILIATLVIMILAGTYYALSYMLGPRILFGLSSCIIEKDVEFGNNVTINDCGHNLDLVIDQANNTEAPSHFVNLTSFKVNGEDYIKRVDEGDPVQIIIFEGIGNIRTKPNLVFGRGQGIKFMHPDTDHKDWLIRFKDIDSGGATLQIVYGYI